MDSHTKEAQYERCLDVQREGNTSLGLMSNQVWQDDPKRLTFVLSRYKFVSKMFSGYNQVLEVGCADAFASRIVQQEVEHLTVLDFDPVFIEDVRQRMDSNWKMNTLVHDVVANDIPGKYQGIYAVDVFEHIDPANEDAFIRHLMAPLDEHGTVILGIPSLESQEYASPISKAGHVNCKSGNDFKAFLSQYFNNVFLFSMNDEVLHTGFFPMANYLFAVCCSAKK